VSTTTVKSLDGFHTTLAAQGTDETTLDFLRIEDGLVAEHWERSTGSARTRPSGCSQTRSTMSEPLLGEESK
jgi:hypothetical protein